MLPLLPKGRRTTDGSRVIATGVWVLYGCYRGAVQLTGSARGILPNAIRAAQKMLAEDAAEAKGAQSPPELTSVDLYQHSVGGSGGYSETYVGEVRRRGGYRRA